MIENIIVVIVICIFIILAVRSYIKQRKQGDCGGSCAGCSMNCPSRKVNKDK